MKAGRSLLLLSILSAGSLLLACPNPDPVYPIRGDGVYTAPNGHGELSVTDGFRILKLSGDPGGSAYELGYAHGYLLAGETLTLLRDFVFWNISERGYDYGELLEAQDLNVAWDPARTEELEGLLQGVKDALGSAVAKVRPPGGQLREVALGDLQVANTLADWLGGFGCSSFTVWGDARADRTALHARNLDYGVDDQNAIKRMQAVISYQGLPGAQRWVTVGWPGLIGCASCFNEEGVALTMHDEGGLSPATLYGIVPRMLASRKVMEAVGSEAAPAAAEAVLEGCQAYHGNNLHVSSPALGKADDDVAGILEYDGNEAHPDGGATLRSPSENPGLADAGGFEHRLPHTHGIIVTNHYIKRALRDPGGSGTRYETLKNGLATAGADGNVDPEEARLLLAAVGGEGTIHAVILEPDSFTLRLFLAEPGQGAFEGDPQVINFQDLF